MDDSQIPSLTLTDEILAEREKWQFNGILRPDFAESPAQGQESVWDYPRPPIIQAVSEDLKVVHDNQTIALTTGAKRVIETAGAPTYYFPPEDVQIEIRVTKNDYSTCEWKGLAESIMVGELIVGWRYIKMFPEFSELYQWVSFYPARVACFIGEERVRPQPGGYYGGWVTDELSGPIKGEAGSESW